MKKKGIIIAIFVVFIIVFTSISSAYKSNIQKNYLEINNDAENIELELIKTKIQEKIDEISNKKITFIDLIKASYLNSSQDDPNGPYVGGLDDLTDFIALLWGIIAIIFIAFPYYIIC